MPRNDHATRKQMREHIAQLAARLMAADGVQDFALAKRKAAHQLGADDTQSLPSNTEIEQALRDYQALYQRDEQRERVREMRRQALAVMREFTPFDPHLTGAVLAGTATRFSDISLMLFADSPKEVELYLLNRNIAFKCVEKRYRFGDSSRNVPVLLLTGGEHAGVAAAIFSPADLRHAPRYAGDGRPVEKARRAEVEALLEADG